jgi:hypothetical protein
VRSDGRAEIKVGVVCDGRELSSAKACCFENAYLPSRCSTLSSAAPKATCPSSLASPPPIMNPPIPPSALLAIEVTESRLALSVFAFSAFASSALAA